MSIRGPKFKYIVLFFAAIALAAGIFFMFFETKGYEKTTALITSIKEEYYGDETDYTVMVAYDVDGQHYTEELGAYSGNYKVGKTIDVLYDPDNPADVKAPGKGFSIYLIAVGIAMFAYAIFITLNEKKRMENMRETHPVTSYAPSVKGEERHLYFLSDLGTAKVGHRIEDAERRVLYEAKVTKFTLSAPTGMDFIDHVYGRTTPHLVGHEEVSEWNSIIIDNHYTFTFDGEYIWDHLKKHGIMVSSDLMDGKLVWPQYRIYRDGVQIALVQSSSRYVHEEDAEAHGKLGNLVPVRGFYRIWTTEENLDLLFVTIMAFARTGANDDRGGNYGLLFDRKRKK